MSKQNGEVNGFKMRRMSKTISLVVLVFTIIIIAILELGNILLIKSQIYKILGDNSSVDYTAIQSDIMHSIFLIVAFAIMLALVSGTLISVYINKKLRPLTFIARDLTKMSNGDFALEPHGDENGRDEVAVLALAIKGLVNNLTGVVRETNRVLGAMSRYDLTAEEMADYPGEFNELSKAVNDIRKMMNEMVYSIQISAREVEAGSSQLADAAQALSDGTTSQAASVISLEDHLNNVTDKIAASAENCNIVNDKLTGLDNLIKQGNEQMGQLYEVVESIEHMSNDIQAIVSAIDSIAFQTNILSLNASVEAARAGEHGKGFAVVADEVRNLANKSSEQSKATAELIESTIAAINQAKANADKTSACLSQIVENSEEISAAFETIYNDTQDEADNAKNISRELGNVSDVVQTNIATAEETAASSEELSGQALNLSELVGKFATNYM